jgi:hypothetical protein
VEGNGVSLAGALEPILFLYGDRERWDRTCFLAGYQKPAKLVKYSSHCTCAIDVCYGGFVVVKKFCFATKYEMLSEEQLKILKEFQKELTASLKAESQKRDRPQPYASSGKGCSGGCGFWQGTCRACDRPGH